MTRLALSSDRTRHLAWLAVGVYVAAMVIAAALRSQGDFAVYYLAGLRAAHGGSLYPSTDFSKFLYAPIFAVGFVPFAMLKLRAAQAAFAAVNGAALIALIYGSGRLLFARRLLPAALIILPLLAVERFAGNNFEHGQINILTLAFIVWALIYADLDRPYPAGALLATAILIKPFALLAGWYLMLRGRRAVIVWTAISGVVLLALPILFLGWSRAFAETVAYFTAVLSMGGRYRLMLTNQSATSALVRLLSGPSGVPGVQTAFTLGMAVELALVAAVTVWLMRSSSGWLALCGLFCLMPSFAPVSWKSYYVALLVPYMALASLMIVDRRPGARIPAVAWVTLVIALLLNFSFGRRWSFLAAYYSAHFVSSLMVLATLAILAWTDAAPALAAAHPAADAGLPLRAAGEP